MTVQQLTSRTFDLLVVGGGIYGLAIARDAAMRGLSVALVERDDFGSGSSFNHHRTIHGGLRYLQHLDIPRVRESLAERRALARMSPQSLKPLAFAVPLHRSITKGRAAMRAAFLIDRVLARGRNDGVAPSLRLPAGRVISRGEAVERFPGMRRQGLTGAALFYDYVTTESDRLTFSWAQGAVDAGAVLVNHVKAETPLVDGRRVVGVRATDGRGGRDLEISARLTVNAAGASIDGLLAPLGISANVPLLKAMNLVTSRDAGEEAIAGRSASGRHLFLVPWRGRALFGTWESAEPCQPGDTNVSAQEIGAFIVELNQAFAGLDLTPADVTMVHRGLVPAARTADGTLTLEKHEQIRDHASQGVEGIISVAGTKYTTARGVAERVTDQVLAMLQRPTGSMPHDGSAPRWKSRRPDRHDCRGTRRIRRAPAERHAPPPRCGVWIELHEGCVPGCRTAGVAHASIGGIAGDRCGARVGRPPRDGRHAPRRGGPPHAARCAGISR